MNSELPPRFAPLPVRLRPCLGESTNSYIRRLARANHLQPSFLHCYLCGPPQWFGRPLLEHLATTAGHSPEALERALADAHSLGGTNRPRRRLPRRNLFARRQDLANRIVQEALKGTQIRTLAKRHNLRCSDIRFALEIPRLTATESGQMGDLITGGLADLIESMISRGLNGRQIWTDLMDHHDYLVTYHSIRHYIRYTRLRTASARVGNPEAQTVAPAASP
ncbi:TniQ family protein [Streptomyces bobili]|uniref:TniQ family protein n=1 Tax=Streptomyces bobili TaxID=67280 RepID=UPI0033BC5E8A